MTASLLQFGMGATPAFNPGTLSPLAWFRSDLGITLSGSNVTEWKDQSGNGYHLTNAQGSPVYPTYSTGGAGGNQKLNFGASGGTAACLYRSSFSHALAPIEYFFVGTQSATSAGFAWLIDFGFEDDFAAILSASAITVGNGSSVGVGSVTVGSPFVLDVCFLGTSSDFAALNGGSSVPGPFGTNPTSSALSVGNTVDDLSFNWIGDIYEVVILPGEVTPTQRASLLAYFSSRYGIVT